MKFQSTKKYGHDEGLSCCFRQHLAGSHCNLLHGYALSFKFVFEAERLDVRNWVVDFGGLKALKESLHDMFDHTLAVAADDPALDFFQTMQYAKIADVRVFPEGVGCEKFAQAAYAMAVEATKLGGSRVKVISCECAEHEGNSAIFYGDI